MNDRTFRNSVFAAKATQLRPTYLYLTDYVRHSIYLPILTLIGEPRSYNVIITLIDQPWRHRDENISPFDSICIYLSIDDYSSSPLFSIINYHFLVPTSVTVFVIVQYLLFIVANPRT